MTSAVNSKIFQKQSKKIPAISVVYMGPSGGETFQLQRFVQGTFFPLIFSVFFPEDNFYNTCTNLYHRGKKY